MKTCCVVSWNRKACLRQDDGLDSAPKENIVSYSNEPPSNNQIKYPSFANNMADDRNNEWLIAHNVRRKDWHTQCGKSYVPLSWSNALADESKVFAVKLLEDSCGDLYHGEFIVHTHVIPGIFVINIRLSRFSLY